MNIEKLMFVANRLLSDNECFKNIKGYHGLFQNINSDIKVGVPTRVVQNNQYVSVTQPIPLLQSIQNNNTFEQTHYSNLTNSFQNNSLDELSPEHKKIIATMGGANYYGLTLIDKIDSIREDGLTIANFHALHDLMQEVYKFYIKVSELQKSLNNLNFDDEEELIPAGYAEISFTMPSHLVKNDFKTFKDNIAGYEEEFLRFLYDIYGKDSEPFKLKTIASSNPKIVVLVGIVFAKSILVGVINPSLDATLKVQELIHQEEKNKLNIELLKGNKELIDKQAEIYEIMIKNVKKDNWETIEKNIKEVAPNDNEAITKAKKAVDWLLEKSIAGYDVNVYIDYKAIEDEKEREQAKESLTLQAKKIEALEHENQAYKNLIAENKPKLIENNAIEDNE